MDRVYLDHNATAPIRPEAAAAVQAALGLSGNPSSVHAEGRQARKLLEEAREAVAALVGGSAREVVFTSGATEALNLALCPDTEGGAGRYGRLLVSAVEHPAVLAGHRFPAEAVTVVPVRPDGALDLGALAAALDACGEARPLLSLTLASNETGVIQPVAEAAAAVHERGGALVVDAVQAVGRISVDIAALGADFLVLSAHKIGGPKGAGALIRSSERVPFPRALVRGGGQERGRRGGTENVLGIAGFGAAAQAALAELGRAGELARLRDRLEHGLRAIDARHVIFGAEAARLPNTTFFAHPKISAETALIALDLSGVAVSSGSACSSGRVRRSHVLDSMGVSHDLSAGAIRVSFGWTSGEADVDRFLDVWSRLVAGLAVAERGRAA